MHLLENTVPFFVSVHDLIGTGFLNLNSLTGGSAYGIAEINASIQQHFQKYKITINDDFKIPFHDSTFRVELPLSGSLIVTKLQKPLTFPFNVFKIVGSRLYDVKLMLQSCVKANIRRLSIINTSLNIILFFLFF